MSGERRCPTCGALASIEAEWCGQCFAPLPAPAESGPRTAQPQGAAQSERSGGRFAVEGGKVGWTCPVCEERNPIEAAACAACGTPFARLFEEPSPAPRIEPRTAAAWSLAFPGLGHWLIGARPDAIGRMVLFAWTLGTLAMLVLARRGGGGPGGTSALLGLFLLATVAVYVLTAIDAHRAASGSPPLVSTRTLLWTSAALVMISVVIATFVTLPSARR